MGETARETMGNSPLCCPCDADAGTVDPAVLQAKGHPQDAATHETHLESGLPDGTFAPNTALTVGSTAEEIDRTVDMFDAAKKGRIEDIRFAISVDPDSVNTKSSNGKIPLHNAAANNHCKVAELLLAAGSPVNAVNTSLFTPLHKAAWNNQCEVARVLLNAKADPNAKAKNDRSPLLDAATRSHREMAEVLLAGGSDPNAKNDEGNSPLDLAANNTHRELAEILLENKADPNTRDKLGNTALHRAAQGNHYHFAEVLLAKGALQNVKNEGGRTPLDFAEHFKNKAMMKLLDPECKRGSWFQGAPPVG